MSDQQAADRGTTGQAMRSRPAVMTVVEDDTAAEDGSSRFTRTEVLRVRDSVIDMLAAKGILSGRRLDAAVTLAQMYHDGRVAPAGWRCAGSHGGGEMSDARAEAWREYCEALDRIPRRCQSACMDVARDQWPTELRAVENMRDGFEALAAYWRMA